MKRGLPTTVASDSSLLEKYDNPIIRALVQLLLGGFGSAVDIALMRDLETIRRDRARTFFDELAEGNIIVDEELLRSEDFLHAFFSTAKCALNTRRREKIMMFARLLRSAAAKDDVSSVDEYEDLLRILDELAYRELLALQILDECGRRTPRSEGQNDLQWSTVFWAQFEEELGQVLKIPKGQVSNFMDKIARTGCYEIFTGGYIGYTGGQGQLTPMYFRLTEFFHN